MSNDASKVNDLPKPKVKPLVWDDVSGGTAKAKAALFGATIWIEETWKYKYISLWSVPGYSGAFGGGAFETMDAAKAAAQDEYARGILSALE